MSIADQILSLTAARSVAVKLGSLGTVHIHAMSEIARANFEAAVKNGDEKQLKRLLIIHTLRESSEAGSPFVFKLSDMDKLGNVDGIIIDKLATKAMDLCGFGESDVDELLGKLAPASAIQKTGSSEPLSV